MDDADRAQAVEELFQRQALAARPAQRAASLAPHGEQRCRDCGETIPAERLREVATARCRDCQGYYEQAKGRRA